MPHQTDRSPAVHIAPEHQSAPKEHWADKEVAKAAEEIREGQFRPDLSDDADLLGMVGVTRSLALKDPHLASKAEQLQTFGEMADSLALAQHPRVKEALARLEQEKKDAPSTQEMIEKAQMLHEFNEMVESKNQFDGQGRWIGKDNEQMRIVNIMSPKQWIARLNAVIGEGRVFLNRYAVLGRVPVLVPNTEKSRSLLWTPDQGFGPEGGSSKKDEYLPVTMLQHPATPEWMVMRFDEYRVPTTVKYMGWRTALLVLITKRIITEKEAHAAFPLGSGPAGEWYRQQLFEFRASTGTMN
jgi:hypothetical protein